MTTLEIIVTACGASVATGLFSVITVLINQRNNRRQEGKKTDQIVKDAIRMLIYNEIKTKCKYYITKGHIHIEDYEDIKAMHKIYHDMGGNGFLDGLMAEIDTIKKER